MAKIIIKGTGQSSTGIVLIDKTIEVDDEYTQRLTGRNREEELLAFFAIHYPGVEIEPNRLYLNILP